MYVMSTLQGQYICTWRVAKTILVTLAILHVQLLLSAIAIASFKQTGIFVEEPASLNTFIFRAFSDNTNFLVYQRSTVSPSSRVAQ